MFAVLETEKYKKGLVGYFKRLFDNGEPVMSYRTVKGAVPFIILKMKETSRGVDWGEVCNSTGVCAQRLLLSKDITIPKGLGVCRFKPTIYRCIPIFNNMVETIRLMNTKKKDINVTVLDKSGALSEKIDELLDYVRHITVLTDCTGEYKTASKRAMNNYGAAIVINDYETEEISDSIVFADKYDINRMRNCKAVFCAENEAVFQNVIYGMDIEPDADVAEMKPQQIETYDFVAALYEFNNFKRAGNYAFKKMILDNAELTPDELSIRLADII